jgi:hypothetical protein
MYVALDQNQADILREVLADELKELRTQSARADSHDYREMLHRRERVLEQLISKLDVEEPRPAVH